MNQRQNDRFKMLKACLNKVNAFASVWAGNAAFVNLVGLLQGFITNLIATDVQQTTDTTGVTQNKNVKRQALTDLIMDAAKAGMGYAASVNDVQLKAGCKVVESDLKKLSDVDLIAAGQNMYNLLNPVLANLVNWGVTAAVMRNNNSLSTTDEKPLLL